VVWDISAISFDHYPRWKNASMLRYCLIFSLWYWPK